MTRSAETSEPPPTDLGTDGWSALDYRTLRQLAARLLARERRGHTLQPTALAHEAFLRLQPHREPSGNGRDRFLRLAARAMRHILVNHERDRRRRKRGGRLQQHTLTDVFEPQDRDRDPIDVLALDEALQRLANLDRRKAEVVQLRFFAGLDLEEVGRALGISLAQVKRDWAFARAWLAQRLGQEEP
ncbi:MAG: ECF-type sigma factor [Planctomycetota bacterium]